MSRFYISGDNTVRVCLDMPVTDRQIRQILAADHRGNKITSIKAIRATYKCGLKEAKDMHEWVVANRGGINHRGVEAGFDGLEDYA